MYESAGAADGTPGPAVGARRTIEELAELARRLDRQVAECADWTAPERVGALRDLDLLAGLLTAARAGLLVAEKAAATSVRPGDRDFEAARSRTTRAGLGAVRREVRQAETLVGMPAVADAVRAGQMPLTHLDALARAASAASSEASDVLARPETQEHLVRLAARESAGDFGAAVARLVAEADPAALERSAAAQRRERFFVMSHQPEGTYLRGRLDRVAGEVVRIAIASVGCAPGPDRDKPQADADALVALAERAVSGMAGIRARRVDGSGAPAIDPEQDTADTRVSGVAGRPTLSLLVPAETFAAVRAHAVSVEAGSRADCAAGDAPGDRDGSETRNGAGGQSGSTCTEGVRWPRVAPATLEDGTPVAMSDLARALCDCEIARIVLDADGVPLDLGRSQRLYTGAQRRAVIVRDRSCAWNGCAVPAAYCEVHHIRWWDRDRGPTSVDNGLLVCGHHHTELHRLDPVVERLVGGPPGERRRARAPGGVPEAVRYRFSGRDGRVINAPPWEGAPGSRPEGHAPPWEGAPGTRPEEHAPPSEGAPTPVLESLFDVA